MANTVLKGITATPNKVSWFEFLLNESLVETHLTENVTDPTATELIALFLYQKDAAVGIAREIKHDPLGIETVPFSENRKIKALKLLALKVAAFMKWDLDALNGSLPLAMVQDMLLELLRCTMGEREADPNQHPNLDMAGLSDGTAFALQLYHRWCIKVIVDESFPIRPQKTQSVQVPGLDIPVLNPSNGKDTVMAIIKEGLKTSIELLEKMTTRQQNMLIPTLKGLGHMTSDTEVPTYDWSNGIEVSAAEITAQIAFELGRIHFQKHNFVDANAMFQITREALSKMLEPYFEPVDEKRLSGYCMACESVIGKPSEPALIHRIQETAKNNYKGLVALLTEDHQTWELGLPYRQSLEDEIKKNSRATTLCTEIMMSNAVARAVQGIPIPTEFEAELQQKPQAVQSLLQWAVSSLRSISTLQKLQLKALLRYLCYKMGPAFCKKVIGSKVIKLFNADDITELKLLTQQQTKTPRLKPPDYNGLEAGELEKRLLICYDSKEIKELVQKLLSLQVNKQQIMHLSDKWRLPSDLAKPIEGLAIQWVQVYSYVLIAKSRICINLKKYSTARELLQAADSATKDIAYKLSKQLRWQLIRVELLHADQQGLKGGFLCDPIKKSARLCINSIDSKHDRDIHPHPQTIALATAFMFNIKEWDYFASLSTVNNEYVKLCHYLSAVCATFPSAASGGSMPQLGAARKAGRELWEHVVQNVFTSGPTSGTQVKRTSSDSSSRSNRDGSMSVSAFIQFIKKIKEPTAVSALLSLTVKMCTMLKTDINVDILFDYSPLWPSTFNNSSSIQVGGVCDAAAAIITHALSLQPNNPSWLRTKADLCFSASQYSKAMKYYLTLGVLSTDYFTDSQLRDIYDEQVLKKIIRCCRELRCYTQVAILCQCFDEIDYPTAFKALQETSSEDAMDGYYEYFWDTTMLEYIINLHHRRGEHTKKQKAIKVIGQQELNMSNPAEILFEAAKVRKAGFFRALARLYL